MSRTTREQRGRARQHVQAPNVLIWRDGFVDAELQARGTINGCVYDAYVGYAWEPTEGWWANVEFYPAKQLYKASVFGLDNRPTAQEWCERALAALQVTVEALTKDA